MGTYLIAHDLGTSGDKATLFSVDGAMLGSTIQSYPANYFNETWVEQNADDWWQAVCDTTKQLIEQTGICAKDIAAVSFSGQMMGCLCLDKEGEPLRPSIIWQIKEPQRREQNWKQKSPKEIFTTSRGIETHLLMACKSSCG